MSTFPRPIPPEFIMHAIACSLPAGKKGADVMKKISALSLQHMKNCADSESKTYAEMLKVIK